MRQAMEGGSLEYNIQRPWKKRPSERVPLSRSTVPKGLRLSRLPTGTLREVFEGTRRGSGNSLTSPLQIKPH